jgi:multidrug efflux pump
LQLASANRGLEFVDTDYKDRKPQIRISIDRNRAAELGVSLQSVGRALETLLASRIVTTFVNRGREYNVVLQLPGDARATATDLGRLSVRSSRTGQLVPLANITRLEETSGPLALTRFNRQRSITMSAGLAPGYSLGAALDWFERTVHRELPASAALMYDGESADFKRSSGQIYITILFALAIVYLVLAAQFESFVHPLVIITTVPLALIGAVLGLKAFGLSINIFSQIAVVILIGIAAKNGVLIVEFTNQLRSRGREFSAAIVEAAGARLRPVLMTSLCTAFGALPFVLASGAGAEQRRPIGVVVFFGTLIAVFLTLFVVPAAYALLARRTQATPEN